MGRSRLIAGTGIIILALALGGCGGDSSGPRPTGPFAETLATIGGGGANGSLGVGWADPSAVERAGLGKEVVADVLGPNAASVIDRAPRLERRFRFDPLRADRLVSVGGSYAFGLRMDGVRTPALERALVAAGARSRRAGDIDQVDAAEYAVVPRPLLRAGVLGLGARDAFARGRTVLAISDMARDALLGRGVQLLEEPTYRAAADCLGPVAAARLIPANLLLSVNLGINAVAIGASGRRREVLCALGGTAQRAREIASSLRHSLARGAHEPVTHRPIAGSVDHARVARDVYAGVHVVRADVKLAAGGSPRFLFETVSHGSLVRMLNRG